MGFTLILPWQGPWKCTFFFCILLASTLTSYSADVLPGSAACAGIRGPAQHNGKQGKLAWDAMSLALIPAREEFAPRAVSSGLLPTTHCCTGASRPLLTFMELGRGKGLPVVLLPALDSGLLTSEHPTRTSPGRDPAAPGSEALSLPPARGPFIFCCIFVLQRDRIWVVGFFFYWFFFFHQQYI